MIYRYYVANVALEKEFNNANELKEFVAEQHCVQPFQVVVGGDDVSLTNKLGETFAFVGRIINK